MPSAAPYRHLLEEVDELRRQDPSRALKMALQTRDLIAGLDRRALGTHWVLLQVQTWATLGSVYRSVADLNRSEGAFNVALAFLDSEDFKEYLEPLARPLLAQRAAYLRSDQGRFSEAIELIDEAIETYESLKAYRHLGVALVDRAVITRRTGHPRLAIADLDRAFEYLDLRETPNGYLAAAHNLAVNLFELAETPEEHEETLVWLRLVAQIHQRYPRHFDLLKLRVLLGLAAVRTGHVDEGIAELSEAGEGFGEVGAFYDQAIALLYLAGIYLELDRPAQVKQVAGRLFPVFRHLAVDRETTATLMLFFNAAQSGSASSELIARVVAEVERLSRKPPHPD